MSIHTNENDTLLGEKILVLYSSIKRGPKKMQTRSRHNAQYMTVEGSRDKPAIAIIDKKLHYIRER